MQDAVLSSLYKNVFSTPDGKKVLRDLMEFGGVMAQTHVPGDSHSSAFNEGQRRTVLRILSFLKPEEAMSLYNNPENIINNKGGYYE